MKKSLYIVISFLLLLLASCNTPAKLIKNERYDEAIDKLCRKMRSGKEKEADLDALGKAFHAINQIDHDKIMLLQGSGNADVWPEVLKRYTAMNARQSKIKALSPRVKEAIGFVPIDFIAEINTAKVKAQQFLIDKAELLMRNGDRQNARSAHVILQDLQRINPNFPGIDELLRKALLQGTNYILVLFDNQTGRQLPDEFEQEVLDISSKELDAQFLTYDLIAQKDKKYDFLIYVTMKQVVASPEKLETRKFTEAKEIADGKQPKRDANGNVILDSVGKVVEETRFRKIEALVNETKMAKSMFLGGSVDFVDGTSKRAIHSEPFELSTNFTHMFATVNGDLRAASQQSLNMMNRKPVPYPSDGLMIMDGAKQLNQIVKKYIRKEKKLVENTP